MRQRLRLNADRNIGFVVTVSARALNVASFISNRRANRTNTAQTPPHSLKPALAALVEYRVDCRGRTEVEAGARVQRRLVERQPVQGDDLFPGQLVGSTPAHWPNVRRVLDRRMN
jgi:hypothetical protein